VAVAWAWSTRMRLDSLPKSPGKILIIGEYDKICALEISLGVNIKVKKNYKQKD
jgi:hypothetical protein